MRALPLLLLLAACGPSAQEVRLQNITTARAAAASRPGPRQAQDLASAVHTAYLAGDYKTKPAALGYDVQAALQTLDAAAPYAGVDAPRLVAWKGLMFADTQQLKDAILAFEASYKMGPNELAGRNLIVIYGAGNRPDLVGPMCASTVEVMRTDDDKLSLIALCRQNMNAASPEGEMAWMSPQLVQWYQGENARRMQQQIDQQNAQAERDRYENRVVHRMEQCAATCKEDGLRCQNRCDGDAACDNRCVEINHACLDRCEARARERLDQ